MKKLIIFLFSIISIVTMAQNKVIWDYPVKPGSEEWLKIENYSERLSLLNIPNNILTNLSTNELIHLCLNYPQIALIYTRNDLISGICYVSTLFNGFEELSKRKNAGTELSKFYKKLNPTDYTLSDEVDNNKLKNDFIVTELMLSSPLILATMNKEERTNLLNVALNKYQLKIENWDKISFDQLSSNFLVIAQILTIDAPSISQKNESKKDMELLLQICKTNNLEFVSTLTNYAYDYLNK